MVSSDTLLLKISLLAVLSLMKLGSNPYRKTTDKIGLCFSVYNALLYVPYQ